MCKRIPECCIVTCKLLVILIVIHLLFPIHGFALSSATVDMENKIDNMLYEKAAKLNNDEKITVSVWFEDLDSSVRESIMQEFVRKTFADNRLNKNALNSNYYQIT